MFPTKSQPPPPKWFKWLMLAFVAYAVLNTFFASPDAEKNKAKAEKIVEKIPGIGAPDKQGLGVLLITQGNGDAAQCGQRAAVSISKQPKGKTESLTINVGAREKAAPQWAGILLDARVGSVWEITPVAASHEGAEEKLEQETLRVSLEALTPTLKADGPPLVAMVRKQGAGPRASCGEQAVVALTRWREDGQKQQLSTQQNPTRLTLGLGELSPGFDRAMLGMRVGEVRTVMVPPQLISGHEGPAFKALGLPENRMILLDVVRHYVTTEPSTKPAKNQGESHDRDRAAPEKH